MKQEVAGGCLAVEPDMEGVYCSAIKQNKNRNMQSEGELELSAERSRAGGLSWGAFAPVCRPPHVCVPVCSLLC